MPKTGDLVRRLMSAGFVLARRGKRHDIYEHPTSRRRVSVWRHARDIPTGAYHSMLRDAGLDDE